MSFDNERADKVIGAELRAVTWPYTDKDGKTTFGNLLDGCPCRGFYFRQTCKHYRKASEEYAESQRVIPGHGGVVGTIDEGVIGTIEDERS